MSAFDRTGRLDVELPGILTDIAAPRVPDYVDDLLAQTAATRQRPRWTFLERWLPMGVIARRPAYFPTIPWRTIGAIAVLLAILAVGLLIVGSRPHLPPPFGPARNGALVFDKGGDIFVRDTVDAASRLLVGGTTDDFAPGFTRDGTRLGFLRRTAGTAGSPDERIEVYIANGDGTDPRAVAGPLIAPDWFDWSADDSSLVVAAGYPAVGQRLYIVNVNEPGEPRQIDVGKPMTMMFPNFRGPDGTEIVFRGRTETDAGLRSGIFAVRPDGTGLRPLTPTDGDIDLGYQFPQISPNGQLLTYTTWEPDNEILRMHLVDLATSSDRRLDAAANRSEGYATFSPDSRSIIFITYIGTNDAILVEPLDGIPVQIPMGPRYPIVDGQFLTGAFSPDGKSVIVNNPATNETRLIDAATGGDGRALSWVADGGAAWQRLAP